MCQNLDKCSRHLGFFLDFSVNNFAEHLLIFLARYQSEVYFFMWIPMLTSRWFTHRFSDLHNKKLSGTIPASLGSTKTLQYLCVIIYMEWNHLWKDSHVINNHVELHYCRYKLPLLNPPRGCEHVPHFHTSILVFLFTGIWKTTNCLGQFQVA